MLGQDSRYSGVTIVIILAVTAVFYGSFLDNYFVFDDFAIMEHVLRGPAVVLQGYNYILRLVTNAVHWPLYYGFGMNPLGYNLFCIALNALNAITLFYLLRQLFGDRIFAALSAILFAGASVGCDAILWKAAYATPLNLFFFLMTIIAYLRFRQENRRGYFLLSIVFFVLAILSKEEAASLPFVILLIELLVLKTKFTLRLIGKAVPYGLVIILYLLTNYILIYHVFKGESELVRYSAFRPLHTLFSSWTVFFISPKGVLTGQLPAMVLTGPLLLAALVLTRDRRLMFFALGWVFVTFLPQSLSSLSQYEQKYLFNSISRHLYLPSVGASMVIAAVLVQLRERLRPPYGNVAVALSVAALLFFNYGRVQERGKAWAAEAKPVQVYLREIGKIIPEFPRNSHVFVDNAPTGRAYMQLSMRAFYRNPTIWWIVDSDTFVAKPGEPAFYIHCLWRSTNDVTLLVRRMN